MIMRNVLAIPIRLPMEALKRLPFVGFLPVQGLTDIPLNFLRPIEPAGAGNLGNRKRILI